MSPPRTRRTGMRDKSAGPPLPAGRSRASSTIRSPSAWAGSVRDAGLVPGRPGRRVAGRERVGGRLVDDVDRPIPAVDPERVAARRIFAVGPRLAAGRAAAVRAGPGPGAQVHDPGPEQAEARQPSRPAGRPPTPPAVRAIDWGG